MRMPGYAHDDIGELEASGVLLVHGRRVQLTRREGLVVRRLLDAAPDPLSVSEFACDFWPTGPPTEAGRRRAVAVLRRHLAHVGLALRLRPGIGYSLEVSPWTLDGDDSESTRGSNGADPNAASTASTIGAMSGARTGVCATTRR